jgi:hypothetical protein
MVSPEVVEVVRECAAEETVESERLRTGRIELVIGEEYRESAARQYRI